MNLNHIQLPASVVANLYRNSLIQTEESTLITDNYALKKTPAGKADQWKYLGDNKKNILVVVDYRDAGFLPDEELSFLTSMLSACKLSLADVAIVNRSNYESANYKE